MRKTFNKDWRAWTSSHAAELWTIFQHIAAGKTQAAKGADAVTKAACAMAKKALRAKTPNRATLTALLTALTSQFASEGNEANAWKPADVAGPPKPARPQKKATVHVTGSSGGKPTFGVVALNTALPTRPKTLRDVHDAGFELEVDIPKICSMRRGRLSFKGRKPTFKKDFINGLKVIFPNPNRDFMMTHTFDDLLPNKNSFTEVPDLAYFGGIADVLLDGLLMGAALTMPPPEV